MGLKRHIDEFIGSPIKIFLFFVIVNLLPSIGLIFTEPFTIWGKIILILFPLGIYFVVFTLLKNIGLIQLLLIPLLIIHAFQIVVFYLFGEGVIAVDMFLNVVTTNVSEAGEVLESVLASVIFVVIIYIPTIITAVLAYKKKVYLHKKLRLKIFIAGLTLLLTSFLLCFVAENKNTGRFTLHEDVYPADVAYNLNFAVQKWKHSNRYPETSKNFTFDAQRKENAQEREIYVLVIGETSRAENWSLYGYERNTTPKLKKDSNLIFFRDAITQSNTTHKSVSIMLTPASAEDYGSIYGQKSIIEAFRETGFTTAFISNQSANRTFTDYFAQEADYVKYFRYFNEKTNNLDEAILPVFRHCIDSIKGNLFIVLHTYGSHFNYKERYPKEYSIFTPDNVMEISRANKDILVNAYDNTILYTDNFLHTVIKILEESNSCSSMFFTSDHGEDILDDERQRFLHASPNPTFYQLRIPMLMWFSSAYKDNYPKIFENTDNNKDKPVATNSVFHTLLDVAHIETDYLDTKLSLVSPDFQIAKRMYLSDHDNPISYYNAGLKDEDKDMIRKRNMYQ